MADNRKIAEEVLPAVGGKENIAYLTHCMSRLRFAFRNDDLVSDDELKAIDGVLGVAHVGDQCQVIIGPNVDGVYREICAMTDIAEQAAVDEDLNGVGKKKKPLTLKGVGTFLLDYLTGSVSPVLPVFLVAGLFKTVQVILGPTLLGLLAADNDLYLLCDMVFNAAFYFLPVYLGFTSARKLEVTPVLGVLMACVLLEPSFVELVNNGGSFSVYGIPAMAVSYKQTLLPILLSVLVMSKVEPFFDRTCPSMVRSTIASFLTIAVMLPITFCVLGPIGSVLGDLIGNLLVSAADAGGIPAIAAVGILTAVQPLLVVTGMHQVLIALALSTLASQGSEAFEFVATITSNWAIWAVGMAAFIRSKDPDMKTTGLSCFISGIVGGLTEPTLYAICLRYPRTFAGPIVGGLVGGLFCGIFGVACYNLGASSILSILAFINPAGGPNMILALAAGILAFVVSLIITVIIGIEDDGKREATAVAKEA